MKTIDLNCDMGEMPETVENGTQESLMPFLTSVSIACGGHAGDKDTMTATIEQALRWKQEIGAHPGYADRKNFGRIEMNLAPEAVSESVLHQVRTLAEVAAKFKVRLTHVKPHGALYNQAVNNRALAEAIARGVAQWNTNVTLIGLAGSPMLDVFREAGFNVVAEAFADRLYEPDGTLRSRKFADALIRDPEAAAQQAISIAGRGVAVASDGSEIPVLAQTICIHSDTPGAVEIAKAVADGLRQAGIMLKALT